jgi:hypothetical protein
MASVTPDRLQSHRYHPVLFWWAARYRLDVLERKITRVLARVELTATLVFQVGAHAVDNPAGGGLFQPQRKSIVGITGQQRDDLRRELLQILGKLSLFRPISVHGQPQLRYRVPRIRSTGRLIRSGNRGQCEPRDDTRSLIGYLAFDHT